MFTAMKETCEPWSKTREDGLAEGQARAVDCEASFAGSICEPEATVLLVSESGSLLCRITNQKLPTEVIYFF
jgi:hypothetical protein